MAPSLAEEQKKAAMKTAHAAFAGKADLSRFSYRRHEDGSVETLVDGRGCRDNSTASAAVGAMDDPADKAVDSTVQPKPAQGPPRQYEVFSGKANVTPISPVREGKPKSFTELMARVPSQARQGAASDDNKNAGEEHEARIADDEENGDDKDTEPNVKKAPKKRVWKTNREVYGPNWVNETLSRDEWEEEQNEGDWYEAGE
ncbi:uncharacterized protein AB675_10484 [Cyphellophora attinorum]|uniref:Uncharacterized protein n=1 Tax=Cyphellophora attinorum TaxID=1664694 RepID=A0A0N1NY15_9EURO|nr:uncharacterized protein AB675_10484 [Phialophora attinorum]KPI35923.1 hypothetical protein AB675_10484 [Phialophora attinorum]